MAELWRYPVKSMQGERVSALQMQPEGVAGDRRFAVVSSGAPAGKPLLTGRERAGVLRYAAAIATGGIHLTSPGGNDLDLDQPGALADLQARLATGNSLSLRSSATPLTDCRPVSLLTLQSIRRLEEEFGAPIDPRRFRANLLLDMPACVAERDLPGTLLRVGSAVLTVTERTPRCRMVTLDPVTAAPEPRLMKLLDRLHDGCIGVYAAVHTPGRVLQTDAVILLAR